MVDLYLQAMMQSDLLNKKKSQLLEKLKIFEENWNREIDLCIAESLKKESTNPDLEPFKTVESKKSKLKETLQFTDLSRHIELALEFLNTSGETSLIAALSHLGEHENGVLDESNDFQDILKIHDETLSSIAQIGIDSFSQGLLKESMAIFVLLTTLVPENAGYWYKAGIAADKLEQYDLAIKFYSAAAALAPELIGPKAFLVDCYLESKEINEAEAAHKLAIECDNKESEWSDFLSKLESEIQSAQKGGL